MKGSVCRILAAATLLLTCTVQAQLTVNKIIVDFTSDMAPRDDVLLSNTSSSETLYINVEVLEVSDPGTDQEQRVIVDDPAQIGLIATPSRLILPPNGRQQVRLVNMITDNDSDRIFRVNFTPVAGETEVESTGVRLMIGYQALVIVRPERSNADIDMVRDNNAITLTNTGNTNLYLEGLRQCETAREEQCQSLADQRLYPGNSSTIELPGDGPVFFTAYDGRTRKSHRL